MTGIIFAKEVIVNISFSAKKVLIILKINTMKKHLLILLAIPLMFCSSRAQTINYETGTIILTTINTALTTMNVYGIVPKWQAKYTAGLAIATGAFQLGYGIYQAGQDISTLDVVNITAGTATIIANAYLLYKLFKTGKTTSWNIYYSPFKKNTPEFGIRIVKRF